MDKTTTQKNMLCLFGLSLSIYMPQALFFVGISGYFSTLKSPLIFLGNFFILAMIPFMISVLILAPNIDKVITRNQLLIVKMIRTIVLVLLSIGILLGLEPSILIYIAILFYDLCFFLYQSISAKISKNISQSECLRKIESANLLGSQLGMACGGLVGSFLMGKWNLSSIFILSALLEAIGIILSLIYKEQKASHSHEKQVPVNKINFKNIFRKLFNSPNTILALLLFVLVLPMQQIFNFISGPWAQMRFQDSGSMLGWLVCGTAFGSCITSSLAFAYIKIRDSRLLVFSPALALIGLLGIYSSSNLPATLLFAVLFGIGFTCSRIIIRASFIAAIEEKFINSATMMATMFAAVLSTLAIVILSHVFTVSILQIFIVLVAIALMQLAMLVLKNRIMNHYSKPNKKTEVAVTLINE